MEQHRKALSVQQYVDLSQGDTRDGMRAKMLAAATARQRAAGPPKIKTIDEAKDSKPFQDLVNKIRGSAKTTAKVRAFGESSLAPLTHDVKALEVLRV